MLCYFSNDIFESKEFYELPHEIQLLFYHLTSSVDGNGHCVPHDVLEKLYLPNSYLLPLIEDGFILPLTIDGDLSERTYLITSAQHVIAREKTNRSKCFYINGILRNRCTNFYSENRGLKALFTALDLGADMDEITELSKRINSWSEFIDLMDAYGVCV